jgi:maintenance of morphology protein 1
MESTNAVSPKVVEWIKDELSARACQHSNTLSFLKGFFLGQVFIIALVILAVRYLFMEDVKGVKKVIYNRKPFVMDIKGEML